ncbi:glucosylceramidase 4 [Brachionus plicatilis]|uniref:Glucosylceramidase 4 n=1 Tax=Brachionus plicatilis TaxID=10195 RepID=A0A3M7SY84_BRAPC|nr:glucosylceramidase 4 [Brachionus plicatilis]
MKIPNRTENPNFSWILNDESYFTLSHGKINRNDIFYLSYIAPTPASTNYTPVKKFEPKLLGLLNLVSERGISYEKRGVIPFIKKYHSVGYCKFWPDLASPHYANTVVNYLIDQNIKFVQKRENPANVPEVRQIEDFLSILKGKVYENSW